MSHYILGNKIFFSDENGLPQVLYITEHSGKVVTRKKRGTLNDVDHVGILLGQDDYYNDYIVHHHVDNVYPTIDRIEKYSANVQVFFDDRETRYSQTQIIDRALDLWSERPTYSSLVRNCQTFVNKIVRNEPYSEDVEKVSDRTAGIGALLVLAGAATKNKTVANWGFGLIFAGFVGKMINRMQ